MQDLGAFGSGGEFGENCLEKSICIQALIMTYMMHQRRRRDCGSSTNHHSRSLLRRSGVEQDLRWLKRGETALNNSLKLGLRCGLTLIIRIWSHPHRKHSVEDAIVSGYPLRLISHLPPHLELAKFGCEMKCYTGTPSPHRALVVGQWRADVF